MKIVFNNSANEFYLNEEKPLKYHADLCSLDAAYGTGMFLECYEGSKRILAIGQRGSVTSLTLKASVYWSKEYAELKDKTRTAYLVDPRLIMLHILADKLRLMALWGGYDQSRTEQEINAILPTPTLAEAQEWLEKNRFTGENAHSKAKRHSDYPGWDIASDSYDFEYLTPEIQDLYDKYKRLWKEWEARSGDEKKG